MICEICDREKGGDDYEYCSEFCATEDIEVFKKLQLGDFGYWPCRGCGCVMEDDYYGKDAPDKNSMCSSCYKETRLKARTDLLNRLVQSNYFPGCDLVYEIEEELNK
jgi:hypothetical protein